MKPILVPVDLSAATPLVCDEACALARLARAPLILLHVIQAPTVVSDLYALEAVEAEEMLVAAQEAGTSRLQALAARCRKRGAEVRTLQRLGVPATTILQTARAVSYIVMGSHGHGAVYDLLIGSTTQRVLKQARCPVVVISARARR